jgi:hypothetical protein
MRLVVAFVLLFGMLGCGATSNKDSGDEDGGDMDGAAAALNEQRVAVRRLTNHIAPELAAALGDGRLKAHGGWRGCVTAELDGTYGSYQYAVQARLDVPSDQPRPYLGSLVPLLKGEGFEVTVSHDGKAGDLTAERDGLSVNAREYDDQDGFVIWGVSGGCVEVPKDQRDDWMDKQESSPDVLGDPDSQ